MASTRKMKRKRIRLNGSSPGTDEYVDIPVIEEISFKDPKTNQQEYGFRFKNNENDTRKVHIKKVRAATVSGGGVSYDEGKFINVERIETISFKDPKTNMQEYGYRLRNNDPPPLTPEGDDGGELRHRKVQFVRYTKNNSPDGNPWVDVERYVEFEVKDPKTNMQEFVYRLNWGDFQSLPKIIDSTDPYAVNTDLRLGFCDPDTELYPDGNDIDPPWRIDPFQNIVNVSGKSGFTDGFYYDWNYHLNLTEAVERSITCFPSTVGLDDARLFNLWISGTETYIFLPDPASPSFNSSNPHITPSTTHVSGEPVVPSGETLENCVGVSGDPADDARGGIGVSGTSPSANIGMVKQMIPGSPACYSPSPSLGGPGTFGIIVEPETFSLSVIASGITATLLGKAADRTVVKITWHVNHIRVRAIFEWDFPSGFDWNVGWPP